MTKKGPRNIGLNIKPPSESCEDKDCPFHGTLPVRGHVITGVVVSKKMQKSLLVKRDFMHYIPKYHRYEKRSATYSAHNPPCMKIKTGDQIRIAECRPLSKTVSFVAVEKL